MPIGRLCLFALAISVQAFAQAQTPVTKQPIHGLVSMGSLGFASKPGNLPDNGMEEINAHPGIYSAAVINVLWSQLEPQHGVFDDTELTAALSAIAAYNARYPSTPVMSKLRVFAGVGTPVWLSQLTGPITVAVESGTSEIGAFWTSTYKTEWQELQAHLASEYDSSPLISEVAVSSCASRSAEPFIISLDPASLANMRQFGFNDAAYMACLSGAKDDYAAWANTPLDYTFNSYRNSDACTASTDTNCLVENSAFTIQVMEAFRAAGGTSRAVVANHGLQNPLSPAATPIYAEFLNLYLQAQPAPSPLEFQTYSPTVDWDSAIQLALTYHPTEIEVWNTTAVGGPANLTTTQLQTYAADLSASGLPVSTAALVSAASLKAGPVAPASLVSIFGSGLSNLNGPTTLLVTDSSGLEQQAALVYTSPTQINAALPAGVASGPATFSVSPTGALTVNGVFTVLAVAPGIFAANGSGSGPAAAQTITLHADGTTSSGLAFTCPPSEPCVPSPVHVSTPGDTVYLVLFGTGFRNRSTLANTSVAFESQIAEPSYAGAQLEFAGLDQINVVIPSSLAGAGQVNVTFTADLAVSNTVTIQIQ